MKNKKISAIVISTVAAVMISGCVKMIPIGQESAYTGEVAFDSEAESSNDWSKVVEEINGAAADLAELLSGDGIESTGSAVSGKASVVEFNTDTPKYYLLITLDGYSGSEEIRIQAGGVYSGTAIRDVQTVKAFENFTNQTEWSQYGKALNSEVDAQVVAPLELNESAAGKTVTFSGAATISGDVVTITPVALSIE